MNVLKRDNTSSTLDLPISVCKSIFPFPFRFAGFHPSLLLALPGSHACRLIISWDLLWEMIREQVYHTETARTAVQA